MLVEAFFSFSVRCIFILFLLIDFDPLSKQLTEKNAIRHKADIKFHFLPRNLPLIDRNPQPFEIRIFQMTSLRKERKKTLFILSPITMFKILRRHFWNTLYFIWLVLFSLHPVHCGFFEFPRCKILEIYSSFKNSFCFK